jgi:hypothetical protein
LADRRGMKPRQSARNYTPCTLVVKTDQFSAAAMAMLRINRCCLGDGTHCTFTVNGNVMRSETSQRSCCVRLAMSYRSETRSGPDAGSGGCGFASPLRAVSCAAGTCSPFARASARSLQSVSPGLSLRNVRGASRSTCSFTPVRSFKLITLTSYSTRTLSLIAYNFFNISQIEEMCGIRESNP